MNNKMTVCKTCGAEIAKSAKACPKCGAKNKKPIYLRPWFIIVVALALLIGGLKIYSLASRNYATIVDRNGNVVEMTAKEIKEAADNEGYFEQTYGAAEITVTGTVDEVRTNFHHNGSSTAFDAIIFDTYFQVMVPHGAYDSIINTVRAGDTITVTSNIWGAKYVFVELLGCDPFRDTISYDKDSLMRTTITIEK